MIKKIVAAALVLTIVTTTGGVKAQNVVTKALEKVSNGIASFYNDKFVGRKTATGEIFDNTKYTAASNTHQLGTYVKVTNQKNGEVVYVKINDRMNAKNTRLLDLTSQAAADLKFRKAGLTKVNVEPVSVAEGQSGIASQLSSRSTTSGQL